MSAFKILFGTDKPTRDGDRRLRFVKDFERLLLMSTAGAFFFALARNVPVHFKQFYLHPDWPHTLDLVLRYLSLTWFLAYFFVSSVNNDLLNRTREFKDLFFDILQSIAVLAATYALGFVLPNSGFGFEDGLAAFVFSNWVIVGISSLSLGLFWDVAIPGLNCVRFYGFVIASISCFVASVAMPRPSILWLLIGLQLFLWGVWCAYLLLRRDISEVQMDPKEELKKLLKKRLKDDPTLKQSLPQDLRQELKEDPTLKELLNALPDQLLNALPKELLKKLIEEDPTLNGEAKLKELFKEEPKKAAAADAGEST